MTRVVIACIAIVIVVLSAGFTSSAAHTTTLSHLRPAVQLRRSTLLASDADISLLNSPPAVVRQAPPPAPEEGPAPVLLAYLGLVVVGSGLAISSVRANNRRGE